MIRSVVFRNLPVFACANTALLLTPANAKKGKFMEENQLSQTVETKESMPLTNENNDSKVQHQSYQNKNEDKQESPSSLILGKFKSAEDLEEAYKQLEKLQGNQSSELGALREKVASLNRGNEALNYLHSVLENSAQIQESAKKYPEYFADPSFKQIYTEAFKAFGADLDVDKLVNLVEGYASARIFAYEKSKAANAETQQTTGGMKFDKNDKTVSAPVRKSIQQMTPKELDEMLDRLI